MADVRDESKTLPRGVDGTSSDAVVDVVMVVVDDPAPHIADAETASLDSSVESILVP